MRASQFFVFVACLFSVAFAATSDKFHLELNGPKDLKNMAIYVDDSNIFIGNPSTSTQLEGTIQTDGSLKLGSGKFVGIKKNYLTITSNYTEYAQPFGIDKKGFLTLYGDKDFKAIPSGNSGTWILASKNAVTTVKKDSYDIKVKCVDSNGKKVNKFTVSGSGASQLKNKKEVLVFSVLFASLAYFVV